MSSTLNTTFTGDSKQLEAAYQKILRENVKLREEAKKTHEEAKHHGEEQEGLGEKITESMSEQVAELGKMAVAWASVEKAVELVNEEYERQIELAEKAAEATREVGNQRGAVIRNLGPISGHQREEFFEHLEGVSLRRGLKEMEADQAVNYALSATGGDRERALELIDLAAEAAPEGGGDTVGQIARGVEQVRTVSHDEDQRANLGRLFALQKISPIKDVENVAAYTVPAVMGLTAQGASFEESGALFSALAKTSGDVEGRRTRTAVINLQAGLKKFFDPEAQEKQVRESIEHLGNLGVGEQADQGLVGRLSQFLHAQGVKNLPHDLADQVKLLKERPEWGQAFVSQETAGLARPTSVTDQIRALQENEELRKQFLKGFTPEAQAKGAELELLRSGSATAQMFSEQTKALGGTDYRAGAEQQLATIGGDPYIQRMLQQRIAEVAEEQHRAGDFGRADQGGALKAIEELLDQTNQGMGSGLGNWWRRKKAEYQITQLGEDPGKLYERMAREQIFNLRYQPGGDVGGAAASYATPEMVAGQMSDEEMAARRGITRTADPERLRKARIAEEALERWRRVHAAEAEHHEGAIHEATPANRPDLSVLWDMAPAFEKSGLLDRGLIAGVENNPQPSPDETRQLLSDARAAKYDLERKGHWEDRDGTRFWAGEKTDAAPTADELKQAQSLAPVIALLEKLLEAAEKGNQDKAQQHRESQASARQFGARTMGQRVSGREVA